MARVLVFSLSIAVAVLAFAAPASTLLAQPACRHAIDALDAREAAALDSTDRDTARAQIEALRRQAALACLGGSDLAPSAPLRTRAAAPLAVPSAAAPPPGREVRPSAMPVPRGEPQTSRPPLTLTACDAAGCWVSDGTRLQRAGALLLGPHGLCRVSGPFVQCPP
jgi:hypothetical protein